MHLLRIEVENFKSFGGEITIPFDEGFTAITGPNGSGKSNSGDAIQFVLGTRSTKVMRADNVADLIFNGGKRGKPARHMSVTLVFANTPELDGRRRLRVDEDEVSFTRSVRLNRKNQPNSSYRIGERSVTATEMRRTLAEAGLHGDGYNIVLQGDVTTLATMTDWKRRGVLEEVAGVTAYDSEIRGANNQRKAVEHDIETIELFEADQKARLKKLEKEREQALKYRDLKEQLDAARIVLAQARYRNRVDEIRMLNEDHQKYLERDQTVRESVRTNESRLLTLEEELVKVTGDLEDMATGESKAVMDQIRTLEIEAETSRDRIGDQKRAASDANEEIEVIQGDLDSVLAAVEKLVAEVDAANRAVEGANSDLDKAEADENEARKAIESGDRHSRDLNRALGLATDEVNKVHAVRAEARLESDRAEQAARLASDNLADLEEQYEIVSLERDDLELTGEDLREDKPPQDRESLAVQLTKLQKQEVALREDRERAEGQLREANRALDRARAAQEARSSKPGSAVTLRSLSKLRESGEIRGILGSLGELTSPKDSAHEEALAFALGGGMNSIVVSDDEVAGSCIKWLRANGGGRATFLPLNKISASRAKGRALMVARNPGIIGFAHDLLDFDESIETAVHFACRNTLIVQSMDVARRNMGGVRMVTLDGSIVEATGAMTGGSASKGARPSFGGAGAAGAGMENLEAAVERGNLRYSTVEAALKEIRDSQNEVRNNIHGLDDSDHSVKLRNWKADVKIAQKQVDDIGRKVVEARTEHDKLEEASRKAIEAAADAETNYESAAEARRQAAETLQNQTPDHLSQLLRSAQDTRTEAERTKLRAEADIASGDERLRVLNDRKKDLTRSLEHQNTIITSATTAIEQLDTAIAKADEDLKELRETASQFNEEHQILTTRRDEIVDERASLRAHIEQMQTQRETIRARLEGLVENIRNKEGTLDELKAELAENQIALPDSDIQLPTVAEADKGVQGLDRRLGQLGDVNMLAIEDYDITVERIAGLVADGKLCKERHAMLVSLAEQLEEERRTRLVAVFEQINTNFTRAYKLLQPGGEGELQLENTKNPFEGGLRMACIPPGKSKRTRRSFLSGGEKSMAALAFIFAIQDYEPSPFYYFDEVDQNLDPFNAERIATLCRIRSTHAQFIMVTLRKVSLTLADHHIGITHAGDGCSRRIADFDRAAAIELGEEFEAEQEAIAEAQKAKENMGELPTEEKMPKVPEPMERPQSLGGLADRAGVEVTEEEILGGELPEVEAVAADASDTETTLNSLIERTEEWSEDIAEKEASTPPADDEEVAVAADEVAGEVEAEQELE